jgi:AAA domain, putative AbiEii toxin, Type IV TA system
MASITRVNRIKVKSLEFGSPPFRKLGSLKIDFADRLTLIAGHNGIGKSTIQGLVANTFGMTAKDAPRSYFGERFFANIERIVYLALEEVSNAQQSGAPAPVVVADVSGVIVRKRCAMTQRSEWKRARVVPRTIEKSDDDPVGQDAKVPLPTIYLGIRRLASIGEADEREVVSRKIVMHPEDSQLMVDFVGAIILGSSVTTDVTHQSIKGSQKKTVQPGYTSHEALAVSMGQDSLGSIATALASFNRLKRDLGDDYEGGLLVIDELDVGFHPHAVGRLAKELKTQANRLNLQIIATTHSPKLIEAVHPEGGGNQNAPDRVHYLLDTRRPRLAEDQSLKAILNDMALQDDDADIPAKPTLCVYFEDLEGSQFCDALVPARKRGALGRKYGVKIKLVPLGIGGSNLIALPEKDPLFADRVLVVDADIKITRKAKARGNTIKLPCVKRASGTDRSPENTIKAFLHKTANATDGPFHTALLNFKVTNPSSDKVFNKFLSESNSASSQRESSKGWWTSHWDALKKWGVIQQWVACYEAEADAFVADFESAIEATAKRLK